jgi:hypothetical protein
MLNIYDVYEIVECIIIFLIMYFYLKFFLPGQKNKLYKYIILAIIIPPICGNLQEVVRMHLWRYQREVGYDLSLGFLIQWYLSHFILMFLIYLPIFHFTFKIKKWRISAGLSAIISITLILMIFVVSRYFLQYYYR